VNTEERQLAEMLHRVTPEPPRRVTVEDVAFRLANEAGGARGGHREPRARRGLGRGRGWAPVLAAASVVVVAGASAGIAQLASHHGHASSPGDGTPSSASVSAPATSAAPSQPSTSTEPTWPPEPVASGMWGAELINRQSFTQASLAAGAGSLYAISQGFLDRISPVTGNVVTQASYTSPIPDFPNRPVVTGNTVWVLSSYSGSNVVLTGYNGTTLAQAGTITVPVRGQVSSTPQGVLTSGSGGYLYVAAGSSVVVVNPETHQVVKQIPTPGQVSSLAVAPDGSKLYVATGAFGLLAYNPATGAQLGSSAMADIGSAGGNLVATSGGVWGTVGVGMSEWVWFAPNGDLSQVVRVSQGAGAGLASVPTFGGGVVWIGGSQKLACANPATGQVMASTAIPTDNSVVEYFGSVTVASNGRTFALYQNQAAQQFGVATLTPPAACSG
jgi:PQQ-like domain